MPVERRGDRFFIMRDGKEVAFLKCSFYGNNAPNPHESNSVYINEIYVDEDYRRQGLATALIE